MLTLENRWLRIERWLAHRLGQPGTPVVRIGVLVPVLFLTSLCLWLLSTVEGMWPSLETMRQLTPWVGSIALVAEGIYLIRVVMRVAALCHQHSERFGGETGIRGVRQALIPVLNILVGVLMFSGYFCYQALDAIAEEASRNVARLLWMMTTGSLMVAIVIGELVSRFADLVERIAAADALRASREPGSAGFDLHQPVDVHEVERPAHPGSGP